MSLDEVTKSINSQTNNGSLGNDGLTAEFYDPFSNELSPILLNVYDFWEKLGTMGANSRTRIISVIYKKGDKKGTADYRQVSFLNLDYKTYTAILKSRKQKNLGVIKPLSCYQKQNNITHTF